METDWRPLLQPETQEDYWQTLQSFVADERKRSIVFPGANDVFRALYLTPYKDVRVVVLGQDPYHGDGQAHGLSFSVPDGVAPPPSLQNIFKELQNDLDIDLPSSGDLTKWARQGVLLLNSVLTVRAHQAASHQGRGWEQFTDAVLRVVNDKTDHVVFILWGGFARKKKSLIDATRHTVIESAHPSPLSAYNGFLGSKPFSKANKALADHGQKVVDWSL
jgi:uracil-DNA glycosylase